MELELEVEHALAVEVGRRRGELAAQTGDGRGGQPPGTLVDQVVEVSPGSASSTTVGSGCAITS